MLLSITKRLYIGLGLPDDVRSELISHELTISAYTRISLYDRHNDLLGGGGGYVTWPEVRKSNRLSLAVWTTASASKVTQKDDLSSSYRSVLSSR